MTNASSPVHRDTASLPFLNGVYVAVDAISGAYLIVDGPYCVFTKAEMQYCHNLRSRLIPPVGYRRVVHTGQRQSEEVKSLSTDRVALVEKIFSDVRAQPDAEIVLATSFDFHELVNFPLKDIARRHAGLGGALVCHVPSRSLGGNWLDGYASTCAALAGAVSLRPSRRRKDAVAIVGYLRDRDEPDHAGNLRELTRLLGGLGLSVESVWLSGGGRAELEAAQRAGLVISLPYAREAARVVAERVKAELCEVGLPLGLGGTERFLLEVGSRVGRREQARRLIAAEVAAAVRDVEIHVLRLIAGRTAMIRQNDPYLDAGIRELCAELGLVIDEGAPERALCFAPTSIGRMRAFAHVPIGYPNYLEHPTVERPFLGYMGFRHLAERIAATALRDEVQAAEL